MHKTKHNCLPNMCLQLIQQGHRNYECANIYFLRNLYSVGHTLYMWSIIIQWNHKRKWPRFVVLYIYTDIQCKIAMEWGRGAMMIDGGGVQSMGGCWLWIKGVDMYVLRSNDQMALKKSCTVYSCALVCHRKVAGLT